MILPETAAQKLLVVARPRASASAPATRAATATASELGNFEAGSDLVAKVTVLAEGTQGHLTGVALDRFGLRGEEPQVWELGVKEVWKVAKPLDRDRSTRWAGRCARGKKYREFGGSFIYPMGEDMVTIGLVVGLDYRDAELSVHDLLQELKTHPKIRKILEGGERVEWGAKTIPSGGFHSLPRELHAPGLLLCGDGVGHGQHPAPQGRPLRDRVGPARGRGGVPRAAARRDAGDARSRRYDDAVRDSFIWSDLHEVRNMRQVFERGFFVGGALASAMTDLEGPRRAREDAGGAGRRRSRSSSPTARRATRRPTASSRSTSSRPSSPRATRRATTSRTTSASSGGCRARSREIWAHMCPAQVYEVGAEDDDGTVTVELAPSNCVQCGAITAKGGRLTPPEGGSGPEYTRDLIYRGFTSNRPATTTIVHVEPAFRPSRSRPRDAQRRALARAARARAPPGRSSASSSGRRWCALRCSRRTAPQWNLDRGVVVGEQRAAHAARGATAGSSRSRSPRRPRSSSLRHQPHGGRARARWHVLVTWPATERPARVRGRRERSPPGAQAAC